MPRASLGLSLLFFTCLAVPPLLNAQRGSSRGGPSGGVIDVQVRYANGAPGPSGIHVRLESPEAGSAGDCQTVEGGKCQFNLASSGVYRVRMSERGYREVIVRVELIVMSRGYASLELHPIPGEAPAKSAKEPVGDSVSVVDASVPPNAREEYDKAQSALVDNKTEAAIAHLQKAVKLYKPFPSAYTLLGRAYLTQKNWKEAEAALQKPISLDAASPEPYLA